MIQASELKKGQVIKFNDKLYNVEETQFVFQGRGSSMLQTKLRSIDTGSAINQRFSTSDKIEDVSIEIRDMEYLYCTGDTYVFMDKENFEQMELSKDILGNAMDYIKENNVIQIRVYNESPVGIELPINVELEVTYTEPSLKNAAITNTFKPATLETGLELQVPPFIETGDRIRVDTRTGKYMERA